jgi:aspartyl-tRNA(Asn)/glutamyl-tRNA(Gln) amidotransferase subunit A
MSHAAPDTLLDARDAVRAKRVSAGELVRQVLERIERLEPQLSAFNSVYADRAIERAREVDEGKRGGELAGVPVVLKDNICTSFGTTTCSSKILENFRSPYDATVVRKLEEAGAVIIGKTNLDEFAMGSSTENSARGLTRNPWDAERIPGGSSGGSAAAVAAGMALGALGSDTGGSIRQPAAMCGIVGVKPTYGRVSRYGLVAFASSLDQIGPLTRTVGDAALMLKAISGHDPRDSTSAREPVPDYLADLDRPVDKLRIGIAREFSHAEGIDGEVARAVEQAVKVFQSMGAELVDVSLPHTGYGIAAYYIIAPCEASSNLARYDGVHFGHRTKAPVKDIVELMSRSRAEGFGDEVKRRIMIGTYALSSGYYDAYYLRALKIRALIKRDFDEAFARCDVILCPTSPTPAFKIGEKSGDPLRMYLNDVFTVTCNIAGIAGISIPCGFTAARRPLPIGLQLLGPNFSEPTLLRAARMYEAATDWHARRPPLATMPGAV